MKRIVWAVVVALAAPGCVMSSPARPIGRVDAYVVPRVDHHQHLVSEVAATGDYPLSLPEVKLPHELSELIARRDKAGGDSKALAELYTQDAIALNLLNEDLPTWVRGKRAVAQHIATLFAKAYRIEPVALTADTSHATIAGYYLRPDTGRRSGHVLLTLHKGGDRRWLIDAEMPALPGPFVRDPSNAEKLIGQLNEAGIARAVVLSTAYSLGSDFRAVPALDEYAAVHAENDWVAAQVERFPNRLVAFCSFNPLRPYAITELERCASSGRFRGIKLHFGSSDVDLRKPEHAAAIARVFSAANQRRLAIVAHLWTDPQFDDAGDVHARLFLEAVAHAPDVTIQVAHLAGGGRASLSAMETFAEAFEAHDPRTRNLYFDMATSAEKETAANLAKDVALIRRIGVDRILFGSDLSPPNPAPLSAWAGFHRMPLTDSEFRQIAANIAPYMHR